MEIVTKKIDIRQGYPEICFMGDTHIGAKAFDEANFKNAIKYIADKPNRYMVGMGDFVDTITFSDRRFSIDEVDKRLMYIDEQFQALEEYLMPIKEKIIGLHIGNHETKFAMRQAYNGLKQVCRTLDVPFLDDTAVELITLTKKGKKEHKWKIHSCHGYGGGWTLGAVVNRVLKEPAIIRDSCIHAFGHSHKLFAILYSLGLSEESRRMIPAYAWFLNTGSFLRSYLIGASTYAERKHYTPNPMGFAIARLGRDEIDCKIKMMDKHRRWGV